MAKKLPVRIMKLSANATEQELADFTAACEVVRLKPGDTLRGLAAAFVAHVAAKKSITVPIQLAGGTKPPFRQSG